MGASKKKKVKPGRVPTSSVRSIENPDKVLQMHPIWRFSTCDTDSSCKWSFHKGRLQDEIWDVILPKLLAYEKMTWGDIFIQGKKHNHSNNVSEMNKAAQDRLAELEIEADALQSLKCGGTRRIYGFMDEAVFNIVWYDDDHGDNTTCVFRSHKKHT